MHGMWGGMRSWMRSCAAVADRCSSGPIDNRPQLNKLPTSQPPDSITVGVIVYTVLQHRN